ncbi:MAG: hypothetical protein B7O98_09625 [Zestosphaera tikiterensis]|uniref:PIN domain-containing protein n=1 Tax=Zestosphaera tikiterensis TaxID=1973259 RepID=A0A2R7Y0Z3_9CREN|nr:MAG: hypothetical protein B7O98_09625 [Zestosphaera tikiterensis]
MAHYLFDASSIIAALKQKKVGLLVNEYTQRLAIYEVLNALWKETYLHKSVTAAKAMELTSVIQWVFNSMRVLDVLKLESEVLRTALELGVTVYDASYIVLASVNHLTLVTEDRTLRQKGSVRVNILSLNELKPTEE